MVIQETALEHVRHQRLRSAWASTQSARMFGVRLIVVKDRNLTTCIHY